MGDDFFRYQRYYCSALFKKCQHFLSCFACACSERNKHGQFLYFLVIGGNIRPDQILDIPLLAGHRCQLLKDIRICALVKFKGQSLRVRSIIPLLRRFFAFADGCTFSHWTGAVTRPVRFDYLLCGLYCSSPVSIQRIKSLMLFSSQPAARNPRMTREASAIVMSFSPFP